MNENKNKNKNKDKDIVDKNLFKAMNYEFAGEIGVVDNEDMKNNRKLNSGKNKQKQGNDKERKS